MDLGGRRGGEDLGRVVEGEPRSEYIILKNVFNKKTFLKDEKSKNHVMSMVKSSKKMTLFFFKQKS